MCQSLYHSCSPFLFSFRAVSTFTIQMAKFQHWGSWQLTPIMIWNDFIYWIHIVYNMRSNFFLKKAHSKYISFVGELIFWKYLFKDYYYDAWTIKAFKLTVCIVGHILPKALVFEHHKFHHQVYNMDPLFIGNISWDICEFLCTVPCNQK